eukprot:gene2585-30973_t
MAAQTGSEAMFVHREVGSQSMSMDISAPALSKDQSVPALGMAAPPAKDMAEMRGSGSRVTPESFQAASKMQRIHANPNHEQIQQLEQQQAHTQGQQNMEQQQLEQQHQAQMQRIHANPSQEQNQQLEQQQAHMQRQQNMEQQQQQQQAQMQRIHANPNQEQIQQLEQQRGMSETSLEQPSSLQPSESGTFSHGLPSGALSSLSGGAGPLNSHQSGSYEPHCNQASPFHSVFNQPSAVGGDGSVSDLCQVSTGFGNSPGQPGKPPVGFWNSPGQPGKPFVGFGNSPGQPGKPVAGCKSQSKGNLPPFILQNAAPSVTWQTAASSVILSSYTCNTDATSSVILSSHTSNTVTPTNQSKGGAEHESITSLSWWTSRCFITGTVLTCTGAPTVDRPPAADLELFIGFASDLMGKIESP